MRPRSFPKMKPWEVAPFLVMLGGTLAFLSVVWFGIYIPKSLGDSE